MLTMVLNRVGRSAYQAAIQLAIFEMFYTRQRAMMFSSYLFRQPLGVILELIMGDLMEHSIGWRWSQYSTQRCTFSPAVGRADVSHISQGSVPGDEAMSFTSHTSSQAAMEVLLMLEVCSVHTMLLIQFRQHNL